MVATLRRSRPVTLDIQLLAIQPHNNLVIQRKGKLLNPHLPIWNNKNVCTTPVAVAFDIGNDRKPQLEVQLAVGGNVGQGVLEIFAANSILLFRGLFNRSQTVMATAVYTPEVLSQLQDDMLYLQLTMDDGTQVPLGTIPVEMYWMNIAELPDAVHRNGIPVELLQALCSAVTLASYFPSEAAYMYPVQAIVQSLFNNQGPRLDVYSGAARFVTVNNFNNITLHYQAWRAAQAVGGAVASSFDIAAVLQYLLCSYGYRTYYCLLARTGYLSLTNLLGRGLSNNPLYAATDMPVVSPAATGRTAWSNHSFVYIPAYGVVADAAVGPHMGYEMMGDYLTQLLDQAYYKQAALPEPGEHTVEQYTGVTSTDTISSVHTLPHFTHTAAFIQENDFSFKSFCVLATKAIAGKWPEPETIPYLRGAWNTFYTELVPGAEEVMQLWMLRRDDALITVKLYVVSGNNELAYNRFVAQAALSQTEKPAMKADTPGMGHFSAHSAVEGENRYIWVYHNAVLELTSSDTDLDLNLIASWYFAWASNNLAEEVTYCLPSTDVTCNGNGDFPGKEFVVTLDTSESTLLHFTQTGKGVRLTGRDARRLEFEITAGFQASLQLLIINKDTLLVNTAHLKPSGL
ncbi:hypothetical protein HNQ91_000356 [Filimonas zeae]|uniref:Uncharacterized protein n=1 Tax=Filimonas zeae TaxID=1737353 RepID=A0A917MQJ2_9BACT|nr:hypothetical protein [Filimonas zeae]MDR6337334.1 hypothetical protein [Filimonas zeae]GGH58104.1 hypothetical protein GCM10011379_03500 [Filimonas zeae]